MQKERVNNIIIVPLLASVIIMLGSTYALYNKTVEIEKTVKINTGTKYIRLSEEGKEEITTNKEYTFTVENKGSEIASYYLYLDDEEGAKIENITYAVEELTTGSTGRLTDQTKDRLISSSNLGVGEKKQIKLTLTGEGEYKGKLRIVTKDYIETSSQNITEQTPQTDEKVVTEEERTPSEEAQQTEETTTETEEQKENS